MYAIVTAIAFAILLTSLTACAHRSDGMDHRTSVGITQYLGQ